MSRKVIQGSGGLKSYAETQEVKKFTGGIKNRKATGWRRHT